MRQIQIATSTVTLITLTLLMPPWRAFAQNMTRSVFLKNAPWQNISADSTSPKSKQVQFPKEISLSNERMSLTANTTVTGVWKWNCCQGRYYGEMELTQTGSKIIGTFKSPVNSSGGVINGTIEGSTVKFMLEYIGNYNGKKQFYELSLSPDGQSLEGTFREFKDPDQSIGVRFRADRQSEGDRTSLDGLWNDAWGTGAWRIQHEMNSNRFRVFLPRSYQMSSGRKGPYEGSFIGENEISVKFYDDPANPSACCTAILSANGRELKWSNGGTWSR